jgi:hypothetical protein
MEQSQSKGKKTEAEYETDDVEQNPQDMQDMSLMLERARTDIIKLN